MDDVAPQTDLKPCADVQRMIQPWPVIYALDDCSFTFKGKSVPGKKLAALLGLEEAAGPLRLGDGSVMQS
jgi:hypothetical protein